MDMFLRRASAYLSINPCLPASVSLWLCLLCNPPKVVCVCGCGYTESFILFVNEEVLVT